MTDTTPTPKRNPGDPHTFHEYLWIPDALAHARRVEYVTREQRRARATDVADLAHTVRLLGDAVASLQKEILTHTSQCWGIKGDYTATNGWFRVNAEHYDRTVNGDLWTLVDTAGDDPGWYIHQHGQRKDPPRFMGADLTVASAAANAYLNALILSDLRIPEYRGMGARDSTCGCWESIYPTDWFYAYRGHRFHLQIKTGAPENHASTWRVFSQDSDDRTAGYSYYEAWKLTGDVMMVKEEARTRILKYLTTRGFSVPCLDAPGGRSEQ